MNANPAEGCIEIVKKDVIDAFQADGAVERCFVAFNGSPYMMMFKPAGARDEFVAHLKEFCKKLGVLLIVFVCEDTLLDSDNVNREYDALLFYYESLWERRAFAWPILRREPDGCVGHEVPVSHDQLDKILPKVLTIPLPPHLAN